MTFESIFYINFIVTWGVILAPPLLIRLIARKPLTTGVAGTLAVAFFFFNVVLFTWMGSKNSSHGALAIGAYFSFYVMKLHTNKSAMEAIKAKRKSLGYDD